MYHLNNSGERTCGKLKSVPQKPQLFEKIQKNRIVGNYSTISTKILVTNLTNIGDKNHPAAPLKTSLYSKLHFVFWPRSGLNNPPGVGDK
jgi:hypothetical protein